MTEEAIALFHHVANLDLEARFAYYSREGVRADLTEEVESLLRFDSETDSLGDDIASAAEAAFGKPSGLRPGSLCGPYRIVKEVGEGGMGTVFLAERADGEVEQKVAIKVIRAGAHVPAIRDRFLRERRILASLQHPGIAHLLDAGRTDEGHPYLVMEYVDGIPIDQYAKNLDLRSVLALFVPVCEAISYAHRNLVIHRDLKPSNILIDAVGRARLLDFGIAKLVDSAEEGRTLMPALTPAYASPEQARGEAWTTATDIYSLGAVLRKLLEGRDVPRDVASIVQKALRPEPEDRYTTADAFAEDLRAFLDNRPVRARTGNAWYHARKFVRRYWVACLAATLAVASLGVGLYIANRARATAQRRFGQVREMANKFIALDRDMRDVTGATRARNHIVSTALEYLTALGADAGGDKELALEIANAYVQVAHVQGVPVNSNLGQYSQADESLQKARGFVESVRKLDPGNGTALMLAATIEHDRMIVADLQLRAADAMEHARQLGAKLDQLSAEGHLSPDDAKQAAYYYSNLSVFLSEHRQFEGSVRAGRQSILVSSSVPAGKRNEGNRALSLGEIALSLRGLGDLDGALSTAKQAVQLQESLVKDDSNPPRFNLALTLERESFILYDRQDVCLNRPAEALAAARRAKQITEELTAKDANDSTARSVDADLGRVEGDILSLTDPAAAIALYDRGRLRARESKGKDPSLLHVEVRCLAGSSYPARALGKKEDAARRIEEALRILRGMKEYPAEKVEPGSEVSEALQAAADQQAAAGHLAEAVQTYKELLAKIVAFGPDLQNDLGYAVQASSVDAAYGEVLRRAGRTSEAESVAAQRAELWKHWQQKLPNNAFVRSQAAKQSR